MNLILNLLFEHSGATKSIFGEHLKPILIPMQPSKIAPRETSKSSNSLSSSSSSSLSPSSSSSSSSSYNSIDLKQAKLNSTTMHKSLGGNLNQMCDPIQGGTCNSNANTAKTIHNKKYLNANELNKNNSKNDDNLKKYFLKFDRSTITPNTSSKSNDKCDTNNHSPQDTKSVNFRPKSPIPSKTPRDTGEPKLPDNSSTNNNLKSFNRLNFRPRFDLKYQSSTSSSLNNYGILINRILMTLFLYIFVI